MYCIVSHHHTFAVFVVSLGLCCPRHGALKSIMSSIHGPILFPVRCSMPAWLARR
jgi:hypothetical protein